MVRMIDIFSAVFPVFIALFLGIYAREKRILTAEGVSQIKKVIVNFTLPAVSLSAVAKADYSGKNIFIPLWIFVVCFLGLGMGFLLRRLFKIESRILPYLCTAFEGGMIGYSLYPILYGDLSPLAVPVLGNVVFIFTFYKIMLAGAHGKRAVLHEALSSASLWAVGIGLILGVSGIYRQMVTTGTAVLFEKILSFISAPTSFMILLCIGFDWDPRQIQWKNTFLLVFSRWVIMLCLFGLTLLVNRCFLESQIKLSASVMLFSLPAPFVLPAFSHEEKEAGLIASALSVMTVFSILVFVCMAIFQIN